MHHRCIVTHENQHRFSIITVCTLTTAAKHITVLLTLNRTWPEIAAFCNVTTNCTTQTQTPTGSNTTRNKNGGPSWSANLQQNHPSSKERCPGGVTSNPNSTQSVLQVKIKYTSHCTEMAHSQLIQLTVSYSDGKPFQMYMNIHVPLLIDSKRSRPVGRLRELLFLSV